MMMKNQRNRGTKKNQAYLMELEESGTHSEEQNYNVGE